MSKKIFLFLCVFASCAPIWVDNVWADEIPLTILHTNDMHSHYKASPGPYHLGGIARLATEMRRLRASSANPLVLDGGDWSEGQIYYTLDLGRSSIEIMNKIGYDATALGNHDWLNGPDSMIRLFNKTSPQFTVVAANLDFSKYAKASELTSSYLRPYKMFRFGRLKVAVIGLVTYELIYDKYFNPVVIKDPFSTTRKLAAELKNSSDPEKRADIVVVISHNSLSTNKLVAGLPNVDVVVHAHDHQKLPYPVSVEKNGKTAFLVEAEKWGFYIGKLELSFNTESKKVSLKNYQLLQIDDTIPEDPDVAALVRDYDHQVVQKYGNIFNEKVAQTNIHIRREGNESLYGNMLTDAYREYTGADVSFEQIALTSEDFYKGTINTVDVFNALSAIYSPFTDRAWTMKTMRLTGLSLLNVANLILNVTTYAPNWIMSVSGMHIVYDPTTTATGAQISLSESESRKMVKSVEVGGMPIDPNRSYLAAVPQGIIEVLDFMDKFLGNKIEYTDLQDTGVEDWRILAAYLSKHSPIGAGQISRGDRIEILQPDVALYSDDVTLARSEGHIEAVVTLRNLGASASSSRVLTMRYDQTPAYYGDDPNVSQEGVTVTVPALAAGAKTRVELDMDLPGEFAQSKMPVYFELDHVAEDQNMRNEMTWVMTDAKGLVEDH